MINTRELRAAKKYGPGYFIREQMILREWTQEDLAEVLGITLKHLNKILQDKQPLTLTMARLLAEAFNTSPEFWINIDTGYRLWLVQEKSEIENDVDIKSVIYERMPIKDMRKKGWLRRFSSTEQLEKEVLHFWSWSKLDFSVLDSDYLPYLTKKSNAYNQFNASYAITWYQMARNTARTFKRKSYNRRKLEKLYNCINVYTCEDDGINNFIEELHGVGVIFYVLPHLQKTYLDGAAFFFEKNPVIVYTGRYKRIDNFWFTVAHEIAHILVHLGRETPFVLDNLKDGEIDEIEKEANDLAAQKLKFKEIKDYLKPHFTYLTISKIDECSDRCKIHQSIILGSLAHDNLVSYKNIHLYNQNVLEQIDQKYLVM